MGSLRAVLWDDHECQIVHDTTLTLLEHTGVEVKYAAALELFREAGARVEGTRVRLPAQLVEQALANAPRASQVKSRGRSETLELSVANSYFGTGSDCLFIRDPETLERRRATVADVESMSALCEALPDIDFVMSMGMPADVPMALEVLFQHVAMLAGTRKPLLITPRDGRHVRVMRDMAALCGEADSLMVYAMPSPPLMHDELALTKVIACARLRIPLIYAPAPTAGATAPASVTAVVVVGNAEVLSGLVLHQLVNPGAPFVYGAGCDTMDMRTMINPYVSPEWTLGCHACCDLARFYGLPSFSYAAFSDSKILDEQWAAEYGLTTIAGAVSRATLLHDVGYLESGMQTGYEAIVFGAEMAHFARALLSEVSTGEEALALGEIMSVGPGGSHLGRPYTRDHYRNFWTTELLDKAAHDRWASAGATTLGERLKAKTHDLRNAEPQFRLSDAVRIALDEMVTETIAYDAEVVE